jgi:hypothetical protein
MQVMLDITLFFACFSIAMFIASRPKRAKQDVEKLVNNIRYVPDELHPKVHNTSIKNQTLPTVAGSCTKVEIICSQSKMYIALIQLLVLIISQRASRGAIRYGYMAAQCL